MPTDTPKLSSTEAKHMLLRRLQSQALATGAPSLEQVGRKNKHEFEEVSGKFITQHTHTIHTPCADQMFVSSCSIITTVFRGHIFQGGDRGTEWRQTYFSAWRALEPPQETKTQLYSKAEFHDTDVASGNCGSWICWLHGSFTVTEQSIFSLRE